MTVERIDPAPGRLATRRQVAAEYLAIGRPLPPA